MGPKGPIYVYITPERGYIYHTCGAGRPSGGRSQRPTRMYTYVLRTYVLRTYVRMRYAHTYARECARTYAYALHAYARARTRAMRACTRKRVRMCAYAHMLAHMCAGVCARAYGRRRPHTLTLRIHTHGHMCAMRRRMRTLFLIKK